jgi:hypothetical protein
MSAPTKGEVYIECVRQGALLKVNAIDPVTGTEASVFGPVTAREALTRTAVQKLKMSLQKANAK